MTLRWIKYHQFACKYLLSEPATAWICASDTQVSAAAALANYTTAPLPPCPIAARPNTATPCQLTNCHNHPLEWAQFVTFREFSDDGFMLRPVEIGSNHRKTKHKREKRKFRREERETQASRGWHLGVSCRPTVISPKLSSYAADLHWLNTFWRGNITLPVFLMQTVF